MALDVGTSSVRALLYDLRARALPGAEIHLPYRPRVATTFTPEEAGEAHRRQAQAGVRGRFLIVF